MGLKDFLAGILGRGDDEQSDAPPPPPVPTDADIVAALERVRDLAVKGAVPASVMTRLARVDKTIRETLPRLDNLGFGSADAYAVMATATDYLPEAVGGYLRLPRDWADSRPIENGKSSLLLLIDQLDLLGTTMDRIFDAVVRQDAQALITNGRFLKARFGTQSGGGQLNLGARPGTPAPVPPTPDDPPRSGAPPTRSRPASSLDLEDE